MTEELSREEAALKATREAANELTKALEDPALKAGVAFVCSWQKRYFMKTGHRRIGRLLVDKAR